MAVGIGLNRDMHVRCQMMHMQPPLRHGDVIIDAARVCVRVLGGELRLPALHGHTPHVLDIIVAHHRTLFTATATATFFCRRPFSANKADRGPQAFHDKVAWVTRCTAGLR